MSSSAGSDAFTIIALLIISLLVLLLLRNYLPLRSSPAYLILPIFLSLALPASIILLVPIDLASSATTEDESAKGIWLPERVLLVAWRITYWLTFVLTWFILPLLGDFIDAGYREINDRLVYSLRTNARYQAIVLGCGIVGLVYIIIDYGFDLTAVKGLVVALAYVWGLTLAIYLMGHGLVAVPRRMFRNANISGSLRRLQSQAPKLHEQLDDAIATLEELEAQVTQLQQRKTGTARDYHEWIEDLVDMTSLPEGRVTTNPIMADAAAKVPAVITDRYLADLGRRLGRAKHQRARRIEEWDRLVQKAADLQAILDSKASKKLSFGRSTPHSSFLERASFITPYMRYHLYVHALPAMRIAIGSLFSLASVSIIWSEIIKFPAPQLSVISLTVVHHPNQEDYKVGFGGQLVASAWILYMCACALASFSDVPVWGNRALVRRNTYAEHACWYAGQIAKLTVPLSYNFLTFLSRDIHQKTVFYHFLGRLINLTPLGKGFDYFFPIFILVPVCATLFNLYGRVKRIFGFGVMEDDDDEDNPSGFGTGGWREGRDLIDRDIHGRSGPVHSSTLGLSPRPSTDIDRSRAAPTLWVPPAERRVTERNPQPSLPRSQRPDLDAEPPEENFFQLFGRRVKNSIDTIETPRWMQNSGNGSGGPSFKRPKWMGGPGNNEGRSSSFGRIFGGQGTSGQVRL